MASRRPKKTGEAPNPMDLINAAQAVKERAATARANRAEAEVKAIARELELANERLDVMAELTAARRPLRPLLTEPIKGHGKAAKRTATAVAMASDWHVEERVDPKTCGGMNEYNPEIAEARSIRFFQGIEWLIREQRSMFQIQDLMLSLNGDMITGYIHEELLEGNFMSPTEATLFCYRLISDGLRFLLKSTDLNINVVCNYGNHGRTTLKKRVATAAANSYEWLMYNMIRSEFRGEKRTQFVIADGAHLVSEIGDYRVHTTHGDLVRSNGGIGGVDVPLNRAIAQWHQTIPADCTMVGHFHTYQSGRRLVRNGSLIGYNAFARDVCRAAFEPPQQAFFLVDRLRGKTQCAPIWVQERVE